MNDETKDLEKNENPKNAGTPVEETVPETPKKKCRWLKRLCLILGILLAVVLLVVAFCLGPIVKYVANNHGAKFLGVDKCEIGDASIYPFVGHVHFEKILIGKPIAEGSNFSRDLFSVDLVDVDVDVPSLLAQKKVLEHFEVRNVSANYEQLMNGETNVGTILAKVLPPETEDEEPKPEDVAKTDEPEEEPEEIFVGAEYFVIDGVSVAAYMRGMPIVFPPMSSDFSDGIGMDEDLTPVQFGMKVGGNFVGMIDFFRKTGIGDAAGAAMNAMSDAANATGEAAKATYDITAGAVSDAATLTGDAVSGAAELTGDAAKATADLVGDAATLTGDAAKATADAVGDVADAVLDIFKTKDDKKSDK